MDTNQQLFMNEFFSLTDSQASTLDRDRLSAAGEFFYLLHQENKIHNLTGYKTLEEYVIFHFIDTLKLLQTIEFQLNSQITDVGTGAGIPGLLLKILRPDLRVCLIESIKKKAAFLCMIKKHFGYSDCHILPDRAETFAHVEIWREKSDYVMARALSSLSNSLELTCPFAKIGGLIILPRGSKEEEDEKSTAETLLGCSLHQEIRYILPTRDKFHRMLIYKKDVSTNKKYPRKPGHIKKRPL